MAQEPCTTPELLAGKPKTLTQIFGGKPPELKRGEFETTDQFEARKAAVKPASEVVVSLKTSSTKHFEYDADRQVFKLWEYAFNPHVYYASLNGLTSEQREMFGDDLSGNGDALISKSTRDTGEYVGENAFGAKSGVKRQTEDVTLVFDEKAPTIYPPGHATLFAVHRDYETHYVEFPVPIEKAAKIKPTLRAVALVRPKPPYFVKASDYDAPTRQYPTERYTNVSILVADIVCVGVFDGSGTLLGHWATR